MATVQTLPDERPGILPCRATRTLVVELFDDKLWWWYPVRAALGLYFVRNVRFWDNSGHRRAGDNRVVLGK